MYKELYEIISIEIEDLKKLLKLLDEQYEYIICEDVFNMEGIISKIKDISLNIAQIEVNRRNLIQNKSVKDIIMQSNDENLKEKYREIKKLINSVMLQKNMNQVLIKQSLSYTNKMLEIINPSRPVLRTYGATGKLKR